jgi:hypothetical protein
MCLGFFHSMAYSLQANIGQPNSIRGSAIGRQIKFTNSEHGVIDENSRKLGPYTKALLPNDNANNLVPRLLQSKGASSHNSGNALLRPIYIKDNHGYGHYPAMTESRRPAQPIDENSIPRSIGLLENRFHQNKDVVTSDIQISSKEDWDRARKRRLLSTQSQEKQHSKQEQPRPHKRRTDGLGEGSLSSSHESRRAPSNPKVTTPNTATLLLSTTDSSGTTQGYQNRASNHFHDTVKANKDTSDSAPEVLTKYDHLRDFDFLHILGLSSEIVNKLRQKQRLDADEEVALDIFLEDRKGFFESTEERSMDSALALPLTIEQDETDEDVQLALQLQEEEELLRLENEKDKVEKRSCMICIDELYPLEFPAKPATVFCEHPVNVCTKCLTQWLGEQLQNKGYAKISCPECSRQLLHEDMRRIADVDLFERYVHVIQRPISQFSFYD